jgi:hypothetical protein
LTNVIGIQTTTGNKSFSILQLFGINLNTPHTKFQCSEDKEAKEIYFTIRGKTIISCNTIRVTI